MTAIVTQTEIWKKRIEGARLVDSWEKSFFSIRNGIYKGLRQYQPAMGCVRPLGGKDLGMFEHRGLCG